jgi:DNA-binding MarR family transcriptional regulator
VSRVAAHPRVDEATALRIAVARIHRALRTHARASITPSQVSALSRVDAAGPLRIGVLAQLEGVAPATMSKVVESLEDRGLLERVADEADARAAKVRVTVEGATTLLALREHGTRAIDAALAALNPAERRRLADALPVLERVSELLSAEA